MRLFACDELVDDDKFVFVDVKDEDDNEPEPTEIAKQGTRAHRGTRVVRRALRGDRESESESESEREAMAANESASRTNDVTRFPRAGGTTKGSGPR